MAESLGDDPKVVKMPTRAAKGAGKSKPRKPAAEAKARIPAAKGEKPRLTSASQEAKLREALQLQLIGLRSKHTKVDLEIEAIREKLKEKGEEKKIIRSAIETAGMPLALFDEAYSDAKTSRVDLEKKERLRSIVREAYGLAAGPQQNFLDRLPEAVKPSVYWEAEGYRCGIGILDPNEWPKPPGEHRNDFERGLNSASSRNAAGIKQLKRSETELRTPVGAAAPDDDSDRDEEDEDEGDAGGGQAEGDATGEDETETQADAPKELESLGAGGEPVVH